MTRKSGWMEAQRRKGRPPGVYAPDVPTEWETFLRSVGVSEARVSKVVRGDGEKAIKIRSWIRANAPRRFVPEKILDDLGIQVIV